MSDSQDKPTARSAAAARKRRRLLLAAMRCVRRLGVPKSTMEEIAAQAGVSRITLYREFGSRETLITEVVIYRYSAFNRRFMARADQYPDLRSMLEAYLLAAASLASQNAVTRELVRGRLSYSNPGSPIHAMTYDTWAPTLARAQRRGELSPDLDLADAAQWILVSQHIVNKLAIDANLPRERLRTLIRAFILPAFSAQADPAHATRPLTAAT